MPIEFTQYPSQQPTGSSSDTLFRVTMAYDGSGRRISKTRWVKSANSQDWEMELVTHYTGIGTEIRESFTGPAAETKVVVNMPNGLGRYGIEDAAAANANASQKFEWYLKNHLGSTMLVYGTVASTNPNEADIGEKIAAYDYRAFGEMVELTPPATGKVTENFTGKEHDDEISLDYFGARYLDPMLGMWTSVDPARQFASPYLYAGNGVNPINVVDPDGNRVDIFLNENNEVVRMQYNYDDEAFVYLNYADGSQEVFGEPALGSYLLSTNDKGEFMIVGQKFDPSMGAYASSMMHAWSRTNHFSIDEALAWGTGGDFDFKRQFYYDKEKNIDKSLTIGVVNGTIMTARDAGNALWGGVTINDYRVTLLGMRIGGLTPLGMRIASDAAAGAGKAGNDAKWKLKRKFIKFGVALKCGVGSGTCEDFTSRSMQNWGYSRGF